MGWNQSGNFDNAKSIWAPGSRWRKHRFASKKKKKKDTTSERETWFEICTMTHLTAVFLGAGRTKKKKQNTARVHDWTSAYAQKSKHFIIVADLQIWVSAKASRSFPEIIYVNTPPCLILFGHNPDSFHSWSDIGSRRCSPQPYVSVYCVSRSITAC